MIRSNHTAAVTSFPGHGVGNYCATLSRIIRYGDVGRTSQNTSPTATNTRAGIDRNRIYPHAAAGWIRTRVISCTPPELCILAIRSSRKDNGGGNESAGVSGPCLPSCQHAVSDTDAGVIATLDETAAGCQDVRERPAIDADLQHATVKASFRVVAVPELQSHAGIGTHCRRSRNCYYRRRQTVVAGSCRTRAEC